MRLILKTAAGLAMLTLAVFGADPVLAQAGYDLSPEQPGRPHADPVPAIQAIPGGFAFVRSGWLTVAIAPAGAPPIATYATDARTVVGADPDYAALVAGALGLRLDLMPVAWADWRRCRHHWRRAHCRPPRKGGGRQTTNRKGFTAA